MKKFYRIVLLLLTLIFLSTFNPKEFNLTVKKNSLFKIENIEVENNLLINKIEIEKKLINIYKKNIFFIKEKDIEEPLREIDFLERIENDGWLLIRLLSFLGFDSESPKKTSTALVSLLLFSFFLKTKFTRA